MNLDDILSDKLVFYDMFYYLFSKANISNWQIRSWKCCKKDMKDQVKRFKIKTIEEQLLMIINNQCINPIIMDIGNSNYHR